MDKYHRKPWVFRIQKISISGYTQSIWTGVTTIELAKGIHEAIKQDLNGLYHFVNNTKICKYDLVIEFNSTFKKGEIIIIPKSGYKIDKSLINIRNNFIYVVAWIKNYD